jgi:hypothetical protein
MNLKIGKVFTSKFVGTGPSSYEKKILPARGLTKVEKHWYSVFKMYGIKCVIGRRSCTNGINDGLCRSVTAYIWREGLANVRNC